MSRIGNKPITVGASTKVEVAGQAVTVKGSKGTLSYTMPAGISLVQEGNVIHIKRSDDARQSKMNHGLVRSLVNSMVVGVTDGFKIDLELSGVGYRAQVAGQKLTMNLGFSVPIVYEVPEGVKCTVADQVKISLEGIDKQQVGQVAAIIRKFRVPDAYHGKGVRFAGEKIVLKGGKKVGS